MEWVYPIVAGVALLYATIIAVGIIAAAILLFVASVHNAVTLYAGWYRRLAGKKVGEY